MTIKPVRLHLRRVKGFDLQALSLATNGLPAVNCARPGPYGNPFVVGVDGMTAERACIHFKAELKRNGWICGKTRTVKVDEVKKKLAGKNLACFCSIEDPYCHADTLLEVANS